MGDITTVEKYVDNVEKRWRRLIFHIMDRFYGAKKGEKMHVKKMGDKMEGE